jgi:hypothetical protein
MKLSTLKKSAQQSTHYRGHRMTWGAPHGETGRQSLNGQCRDCQAYGYRRL